MVDTFADARLDVVPGAGLFSHEERPAEVAAALLALVERTVSD
jgi:pimeloyl-ACP methyl ester carboxylesterase